MGRAVRDGVPCVSLRLFSPLPPLYLATDTSISRYYLLFSSWLGQNSKQNKMQKLLSEIQIHMRLKVSANTTQIRQHYLPTLFPKLIDPLCHKDAGAVSRVCKDDALSRESCSKELTRSVIPS